MEAFQKPHGRLKANLSQNEGFHQHHYRLSYTQEGSEWKKRLEVVFPC